MIVLSFNDTCSIEVELFSFAVVQKEIEEYWNKIKEFTEEQLKSSKKINIPIGGKNSIRYKNAYDTLQHIKSESMWSDERHTIFRTLGEQKGNPEIRLILKQVIKAIEPEFLKVKKSRKKEDEVLSAK